MFIYSFFLLILLIKKNAHKIMVLAFHRGIVSKETGYESRQTLKLNTTVL